MKVLEYVVVDSNKTLEKLSTHMDDKNVMKNCILKKQLTIRKKLKNQESYILKCQLYFHKFSNFNK